MVITCDKRELVQAIQIVLKAVSSKPQMPILSGIYIKAYNDTLELQGTDYDLSIIAKVPANVETEGIVVVSGKYLFDVVRNLPGDKLVIKSNDRDNTVNISSQTAQFNLLSMEDTQFPVIEHLKGEVNFSISNQTFLNCIRKTSFSCSTDENRPIYSGCLMDFKEDKLIMVATNMHRLALMKERFSNLKSELKIIVPAKILNELSPIFNSRVPTDIDIACTKNKISFSYENVYIISRLIEGMFPEYSRVIPPSFKTNVTINKNEFKQAIERISLISKTDDYNITHFEFADGIVRISSDNPNIGKAEETVRVNIEGPNIDIAFNATYILDVLKVIETEKFLFSFKESLTTAAIHEVVEEDGVEKIGENFTYVVTPVRTKA